MIAQAPPRDRQAWLDTVGRALERAGVGDLRAALALADTARTSYAPLLLDQTPGADDVDALLALGRVYFDLGYNDRARDVWSDARRLLDGAALTDDASLRATLHNNLGQVAMRRGELAQAEDALREAVALREPEGESIALAYALDNLGNVLCARGKLDEARALHDRALALLEARGPSQATHAAVTYGNLAQVFEKTGDLARAEAYRARAFDTHLRLDGPLDASSLLDAQELGRLALRTHRHDRLDWLVDYLLTAGGDPPDPSMRFLADALKALAERAHDAFRLDLSTRLLRRAVDILTVCEGADAGPTLDARRLLAIAQRAGGDLAHARDALQAILDAQVRVDDVAEACQTRIELGKVFVDLGAQPLAAEILERAIEELRALPRPSASQLASACGNLAILHYHAGRIEQAEARFEEALDVLSDTPQNVERPWLEHALALLKYHTGANDEALALLESARTRWTALHDPRHPFVATCAANMALAHWSAGRRTQALDAFRLAHEVRDLTLRRELALGSEARRLACARQHLPDVSKVVTFCLDGGGDPEPEVARFAAELVLRRKGLVLDAVSHTLTRLRDRLDATQRKNLDALTAVQAQIAAATSGAHATADAPPAAALRALAARERALQDTLSDAAALQDPELTPVSLRAVQRALGDGVRLLEYVRYTRFSPRRDGADPWREDRYALLSLDSAGAPRWHELGAAEAVDAAVTALRTVLADPRSAPWRIDAAADALRKRTLPSDAMPPHIERLLIAPDAALSLVPFGLPPLTRDAAISYLACGRDLLRAESPATGSGPLVMAAPDFDSAVTEPAGIDHAAVRTRAGFAALPGTAAEGEAVAQRLAGATLLTGREASASRLRETASPTILHIATHGVFEPLPEPVQDSDTDIIPLADAALVVQHAGRSQAANPMQHAGLVFAGANGDPSRFRGAIVTAQEIAHLDLRGTALVVLSACETGLGHRTRGEEFAGLRRALAIAGARTQVTSLWKVDDDATCALMTHFYDALAQGAGRAEALTAAQRALAGDDAWSHPFYWAAFVCAGDTGPLPAATFA